MKEKQGRRAELNANTLVHDLTRDDSTNTVIT